MKLCAALFVVLGFVIADMAMASPQSLLISWQKPTTRANCTPLPSEQIKGYILYIVDMYNGKTLQIGLPSVLSKFTAILDDAKWYLIYMRTIDSANLLSTPSQVVQFDGSTTTMPIPEKPSC